MSVHPNAATALDQLLRGVSVAVPPPDLAFLFVPQFHAAQFAALVQQATDGLPDACRLVSVVGGGIIGDNMELDEPSQPGLSLLAGSIGLDNVDLFYYNELVKPPPPPDSDVWATLRRPRNDAAATSPSSFLLFADPWSPVESVLEGLGSSSIVAGGISVPTGTGPSVAIDRLALPQGSVVGVCFKGPLKVQVLVAQGCRPTGPTYTITSAEDNVVLELDSKPAMRVLENYIRSIESPAEQSMISSGLICGIQAQSADDYLIRQVLGFVPSKGGIAVAGNVGAGETLRFHVRDKAAAVQDLELMVKRAQTERLFSDDKVTLLAALQISCVARGRNFFGAPNADLSRVKKLCDGSPVAGFFANGEIGPVGLAGISTANLDSTTGTHVHGFTTVVALLCDMSSSAPRVATSKSQRGQIDAWG